MVLTLLLGGLAAWGAPKAAPRIRDFVETRVLSGERLEEVEASLFAFAVCLLGAAVLSRLADEGNGFWLAFGAVLGVMAPRLRDWLKARRQG